MTTASAPHELAHELDPQAVAVATELAAELGELADLVVLCVMLRELQAIRQELAAALSVITGLGTALQPSGPLARMFGVGTRD